MDNAELEDLKQFLKNHSGQLWILNVTEQLSTTLQNDSDFVNFIVRVQEYYDPIIVILGLLTNLSCLILYLRRLRTKTEFDSYVDYIIGLSVSAFVFLLTLLVSWLPDISIDIYSYEPLCQYLSFVGKSSRFLHTWLLVCLATDRAFVIACKKYRKTLCRRFRARCVCIALAIITVTIYLNTCLMEGTIQIYSHKVCGYIPYYLEVGFLLAKFDVILNVFLPCLLLLAYSIASFIYGICCLNARVQSRLRSEVVNSKDGEARLEGRPRMPSSVILTAVMAVAFVVTSVPNHIIHALELLGNPLATIEIKTTTIRFIQVIFKNAYHTYYALPLFFCLIFDHTIRKWMFVEIRLRCSRQPPVPIDLHSIHASPEGLTAPNDRTVTHRV